ncbi:MAG: hypothetical protein A2X49_06405 [Lentisphaerae bacterium GWF2_52_8]|nr:MAG: hypothetical protein A2X49_06405 [Lentisphaerae bacterium GWF2_52_8]
MKKEPIVDLEPRDFRHRVHPNITQRIQGGKGDFSISCDFLGFPFSRFKGTMRFNHPRPPFARIFVLESGQVVLKTPEGRHLLKSGNIYFLPPEQAFEASYLRAKIKGFHLYLSDGLGFPVGTGIKGVPALSDSRVFASIMAAVESGEPALYSAAVFQAVLQFCRPLFPELEARAALSPTYRKVLEMLAGANPESLRVGEIAKTLRISRAALSKGFQRQFKMPLKRFILDSALRRAKSLLLETDMSASEIAASLGYREAGHFQRFFRAEVGMTPLGYRGNRKTEHPL